MANPTVLVTSLGLMGGSLAAALAGAGWRVLLHHRRPEVAREAERRGFGSAVDDPAAAMAGCDLAVVCTPVPVIAATVRRLAAAPGRAVITDIGSTKGGLCAELAELGRAGRFVGSHPMCGSHLQGLDHADATLYRGAIALVTPLADTPAPAVAAVERLWQAVGCRVQRIDPEAHDRAVVAASHLPHVLASAAAAQLDAAAAPICAGGFRDTTRVAAGSPQLWSEILLANRAAVLSGMADTTARLARLREALERGDQPAVEAWLQAGQDGRLMYENVNKQ